MTNTFQGIEYPNRDAMIEAIAYEFITACGNNDAERVTDILAGMTDEEGATEAMDCWDLGDVNKDDMVEAIAEFRATRPDMAEA